jgi:hypothetical protein
MRVDMVLETSGTEGFGLNGFLGDTNVSHKLSGMVGTHKSTGLRGINQRLGIDRIVMIRNF